MVKSLNRKLLCVGTTWIVVGVVVTVNGTLSEMLFDSPLLEKTSLIAPPGMLFPFCCNEIPIDTGSEVPDGTPTTPEKKSW